MQLNFRSLFLENFKSFIKPAHVVLDRPGVTFMYGVNKSSSRAGSNGVGKSTIWDALLWTLTGSTIHGLRNTDVVTWGANKPTVCSLIVEADEKRHVIKRSTNPNKIELNGNPVSQNEIDQILQLPKSIIPYTILIGQDQELFFDLKPEKKMELLSEVLNLYRWTERSSTSRSLLTELQQEINELELQIDNTEDNLSSREEELKHYKRLRDSFENTNADQRKETTIKLKRDQQELDKVMHAFSKVDRQYETATLEVKHLQSDREELLKKIASVESKITGYSDMNEEADSLEKSLKEAKCPTCGQSIHGERGTNFRRTTRIKIESLRKDVKNNSAKWLDRLKGLQAELNYTNKELNKFSKMAEDVNYNVRDMSAKIASLENSIATYQETLKAPVTNPYEQSVKDTLKRVNNLRKELDEQEAIKKQKERREPAYSFWTKWFKDIRLILIEETLQELSVITNCLLDEFGMTGWNVSYNTEKETKAGTVKTGLIISIRSPDSPKAIRWENWSGGEKQRLRIIGTIALAQVLLSRASVIPNLIVFDEPTKSLSQKGVDDLCSILENYATCENKSVWLVDHHQLSSARFSSVLTIEKTTKEGSIIK